MRASPLLIVHSVALLGLASAYSLHGIGYSLSLAKRATPKYGYVAFVNCWTSGSSGGARSELDFYADTPTNFGDAKPDASVATSNGSNYEWEDKPDQFRYGAQTNIKFKFLLGSNAKAASDGDLVGSASAGSATYDVFKNKPGKGLYSDPPFGCQAFYQAVPKGSATSTTRTSPAGPTSTSSGAPGAAAATTTSTAASPTDTAAAATSDGSSSGLSRGGQIGVGVGVGIGGAVLIAVLALVLLRWLRARNAHARGHEPGIEQSAPMAKTGTENYSQRSTNGIDGSSHYASTQAT